MDHPVALALTSDESGGRALLGAAFIAPEEAELAGDVQHREAHVLIAELVGRVPKMPTETGNGAKPGGLRSGREAPDRHVLDHALAQRADRLRKAAGGNGAGIAGHGLSPPAPWTIHALKEKGAVDKAAGRAA